MTLEKLSEQVQDVVQHFRLPPCLGALRQIPVVRVSASSVGMGVGAGGYVLLQHALKFPESLFGLILLSPAALRASWWEWSFGSAALWYLKWRGMDHHITEHLTQRLISGRSSDLSYTVRQAVQQIAPTALSHFFHAVLSRPDLTPDLSQLKIKRLLLMWGYEALYKRDSQELNRAFDAKDHLGWAEIDQCGVLLTEECPFRILDEIRCYIQALQTHGYCLDWVLASV